MRGAISHLTKYFDFSLSLVCVLEGPQAVQELWAIMVDKLLEAIHLEPDVDIVAIMMDSLCKVQSNNYTLYHKVVWKAHVLQPISNLGEIPAPAHLQCTCVKGRANLGA